MTIPFVAGPGGGGFMVSYLARTHQVVTIDGRENCSAACTPDMFLDHKTGQPLDYFFASDQPLATGVPSMVATWAKAVGRYGRLSLAADLAPTIGVARRGFRINTDFRQLELSDLPELRAYTASRKLFLTPAGNPLPVGSVLRNPDLAKTYQLLASHGPSYLYNGPLGKPSHKPTIIRPGAGRQQGREAAWHHAHERPGPDPGTHPRQLPGPGHLQHGATVEERHHRGRGAEHPQRLEPGREPRATALFHYLEASRLAYADRNSWVGDPRYVGVPVRSPLDPKFAATRRCLVHHQALTSPVAPGDPVPPYQKCKNQGIAAPAGKEGMQTNNIVTADKWGDVLGYTNIINFFGGSGETVPG